MNNKKVLVLGNGFIASHLPYQILNERIPLDISGIEAIIDRHKPDVLINTAGKCGIPDVGQCELIKDEVALTNTALPILIATTALKHNIQLVHISSGCCFYGKSPRGHYTTYDKDPGWQEDDYANPTSFYSRSKYAADLVLGQLPNVLNYRIRMPISWKKSPRNLLSKITKYENVLECLNSITLLGDLENAINWGIENNKQGIYHVTSTKPITHIKLLDEYQKHRPDHKYNKITERELDGIVSVKRSNCILDVSKIQRENFEFLPLDETISDYVRIFCQ